VSAGPWGAPTGWIIAVRRRLLVKPGLTGLWQVPGRSDLSWESVRLDLSYVENWFLGLDLSIIARTVSAIPAHPHPRRDHVIRSHPVDRTRRSASRVSLW
jgi:hypothetical protein